jgi:hypothetical protein
VGLNRSTTELSRIGETNINALSETRRVVIADRASVTKRFKDGIGLQGVLGVDYHLLVGTRFGTRQGGQQPINIIVING